MKSGNMIQHIKNKKGKLFSLSVLFPNRVYNINKVQVKKIVTKRNP